MCQVLASETTENRLAWGVCFSIFWKESSQVPAKRKIKLLLSKVRPSLGVDEKPTS